jgi:hypothetical protein
MNSKKTENQKSKDCDIVSIKQFKEKYFPSTSAFESCNLQSQNIDYGCMVAMSIMDGIKNDLNAIKK